MIKRLLAILLLLTVAPCFAATPGKTVKYDFTDVSVAQVLQVIFGDSLKTPYVLGPDVANDQRVISFRWSSDKGDLHAFLGRFLDSLGYSIDQRAGIDFVVKKKDSAPSHEGVFVYRPKYREVGFLTELLSPLLKGDFTDKRIVHTADSAKIKEGDSPPPDSAASYLDRSSDILVFSGSPDEIERLKALLPQVDVPFGQVMVRCVVYEVSTTNTKGSAFGLLASLIGGKLSLGIGSTNPVGSFLQLKNTNLDAVYSLLDQDSRFKVISSPSLRVRSGGTGTFSVGQDVPVLGAISYPSSGQAVQSIEYRSSGVIFNIQPTVRESVIDLDIDQQISDFVATTTGVNNSPTLTKRDLKTSISVNDGDLIVLGGLAENKDSDSRDGPSFLPHFLQTTGKDQSQSEIFLVLQVKRI
jgi:type II secretory pathway component GspD/PulD (secretin)